MQTNMHTVKRNKMLELCLPFIVDFSFKESLPFAKYISWKGKFWVTSNQPSSRVKGEKCLLVSSGKYPWDKQDVLGNSDGHWSIPSMPFCKMFFSSSSLTRAEGNRAKNQFCFLPPGRLPIPQASLLLPSLSLSVYPVFLLWHCDRLACTQHLHHRISPEKYWVLCHYKLEHSQALPLRSSAIVQIQELVVHWPVPPHLTFLVACTVSVFSNTYPYCACWVV